LTDDPAAHDHQHTHEQRSHDDHDQGHGHGGHGPGRADAGRARRLVHAITHAVTPHSHDSGDKVDRELEASRDGLHALWVSLGVLAATAAAQAVVVILSGSVALLGDTVHNAADALTAVPLGIAFLLGRRAPTRRYTYGFGRAEDLAGIVIVVVVAASAVFAAWTAIDRLLHPEPLAYLPMVAAAAVIGFLGNEAVARYRIRVGRRIGSAALVADGLHARTDGFASLAVLAGAGGAALEWGWADPVVGLVITVAIVVVLRDAAREVYRRIMDSVDPALVDIAETALRAVPGVMGVGVVRLRWIGHQLRAETDVVVDGSLTVVAAHQIAVAAEHALLHDIPRLQAATVHTDHPADADQASPHDVLAHHRAQPHSPSHP
jgi:cation diffusion facilitator family transporter